MLIDANVDALNVLQRMKLRQWASVTKTLGPMRGATTAQKESRPAKVGFRSFRI